MKRNMVLVAVVVTLLGGAVLYPVLARSRETSRNTNTSAAFRKEWAELQRLESEGYVAFNAKKYDVAEELLKRCVARNPKAVFAWYKLGETLEATGRDKEALAAYQQAFFRADGLDSTLEQDPYTLGQYGLLCSRLGRWPEAVELYEKALSFLRLGETEFSPAVELDRRVPNRKLLDASLHVMRGIIQDRRGENPEVLAEFQQAAELLPKSAVVQYYLGQGLRKNGRADEATAAFQKAAAQGDPDLRAAAEKELRLLKEQAYVKEQAGR